MRSQRTICGGKISGLTASYDIFTTVREYVGVMAKNKDKVEDM